MTNKPEPVVEERFDELVDAARRAFWHDADTRSNEYAWCANQLRQMLKPIVESVRTAAVARREAEIVELADAAERESKTYQQYANAVVRIVMNLKKQNGGGA